MHKLSAWFVVAFLTVAGSARAQDEAPAAPPVGDAVATPAPAAAPASAPAPAAGGLGLAIGADLAFQLPLGELGDRTGMGFGALIRAEYKLIPRLNVTFRTGYIYSLAKSSGGIENSVANIPVWVGGKLFLTRMIYAGLEGGLNRLMAKEKIALLGTTVSDSSAGNKLGGNVGAGLLLGNLDLRAQLEVLDFGAAAKHMAVMINAGYNFAKL